MSSTVAELVPIRDCTWFPHCPADITFHRRSLPATFHKRVSETAASVVVSPGDPPSVTEVTGGYFLPGTLCLYDENGVRIEHSCVRRGTGLLENFSPGPASIAPSPAWPTIAEPLLWLCEQPNHWGHFLTEGISRLWARSAEPDLRGLPALSVAPRSWLDPINDFHGALRLPPDQFRSFNRPVRLARCFVPSPSFANRGLAYTGHLTAPNEVARALLVGRQVLANHQPVYLSRSRFGNARTIRHEDALEALLADRGVRIVYPELLSLEEQVLLFNTHRVFIGCWGSAFHNLAFSLAPRDIVTHVLCDAVPNVNFMMFDAIGGVTANYVEALGVTEGSAPQKWPNLDLCIDVPGAMQYLRDAGLV